MEQICFEGNPKIGRLNKNERTNVYDVGQVRKKSKPDLKLNWQVLAKLIDEAGVVN